ncbi:hypothetical protein ANN_14692 [Periplaneta americana]|uniref:DUF4817 domain-containing protein n=1 Tax=Periplaneta americana TaxID=6978 RepID=A0ABQ8SY81_PERAM|nr:hypothetical protein ANN_14692 [Periplaneta americana]
MAGRYSFREQADIIFMCGRANGNGREGVRLYQMAFPDRRQPNHQTFVAVYRCVAETGTVAPQTGDRGRPRVVRTPNLEDILHCVEDDPGISTRQLAVATDEATFGRDGITNFHNEHVWADRNPRAVFQARHQQQFRINVWAGIVGDCLVGPYVLSARLTGAIYRDFIQNTLPELLHEDVPLNIRQNMWFMHDGAPAHFSRLVRDTLNDVYHDIWIGRGGPVQWPARSPDFILWIFIFGGTLNNWFMEQTSWIMKLFIDVSWKLAKPFDIIPEYLKGLRVFENKVLRKIFGAKSDEVTGEWRKLHNTELQALYSSPDIIRIIKSRRLRWAGHVARMGESRKGYRVLVGRPEGKIPLERPRRRWEDNVKMDLREVGYDDRDWINLAQDRDQWRAYVRAAMNLRVPWKPYILLADTIPMQAKILLTLCRFLANDVEMPGGGGRGEGREGREEDDDNYDDDDFCFIIIIIIIIINIQRSFYGRKEYILQEVLAIAFQQLLFFEVALSCKRRRRGAVFTLPIQNSILCILLQGWKPPTPIFYNIEEFVGADRFHLNVSCSVQQHKEERDDVFPTAALVKKLLFKTEEKKKECLQFLFISYHWMTKWTTCSSTALPVQPAKFTDGHQHSLKWITGKQCIVICPVVQQEEGESIPVSSSGRVERVKWTERIRNEAVLERVGEGRMILKLIRKRKRNWLDHWLRINCLLKDALEGMLNGRRVWGRRKYYQVINDVKVYGSYAETKRKAENMKENAGFAVKDLPLGKTLCMSKGAARQTHAGIPGGADDNSRPRRQSTNPFHLRQP